MTQFSDTPFHNLLLHIRPHSQRAAQLLEQMHQECGQQAAIYAAFILICLRATTETLGNKPIGEFTSEYFKEFAFFSVANEHALALFEEMLRAYQSDHVTASR